LPVDKVTWQKVGHVTEPGRYMFRFGWLTIVPDDLAIWKQFPDACFTLVQTSAPPLAPESDEVVAQTGEFHLGAFELHAASESASPDIRPEDAIAAPAQSSPLRSESAGVASAGRALAIPLAAEAALSSKIPDDGDQGRSVPLGFVTIA
jgi:hypothetical protein